MGETERLGPQQAENEGEFIIALKQLKQRSGLTYRQLEQRAAARGETLPRSTLANVLSSKAKLRPELLTAFVRACGEDERAAEWLAAWEALTAREALAARDATAERDAPAVRDALGVRDGSAVPDATAPDADPPSSSGGPSRGRPPRVRRWLLASLAVLLPVCVTAWVVLAPGEQDGSEDKDRLPGGRVQIRPVLSPTLCLTDGRVPGYEPLVAVQRPCGETAPQETLLESLGGDEYRIRWFHPDHGKACLKALRGKPADGLLEPWEACDQTSRFHITPYGPDGSHQFVLRVNGQGCVAIQGAKTTEGAAALMEPCTNKRSHVFTIEPAP
ncbi:RICIN domain-containing protein [Streptomyces sp. NPDC055078]